MFDDITIMIPTLGRVNKQQSLSNLTPELLKHTQLLVDWDEFDDHDLEHGSTCEVVALPQGVTGIANIRQWALDNCLTQYLFLIDDDMVFFKRDELDVKLHKCSDDELNAMFLDLLSWMCIESYPLVGLSARQGNNHVAEDYREATRQMNFHGIDCDAMSRLGLRFDESEVMEDFNLVLSLLTRGIANRVMYQYCWNQLGSGAQGGCSSYRTNELQAKCANELAAKYPDFVTVVEKKSKSSWKGMEVRTDVRIQWKKAFEYGVANDL